MFPVHCKAITTYLTESAHQKQGIERSADAKHAAARHYVKAFCFSEGCTVAVDAKRDRVGFQGLAVFQRVVLKTGIRV